MSIDPRRARMLAEMGIAVQWTARAPAVAPVASVAPVAPVAGPAPAIPEAAMPVEEPGLEMVVEQAPARQHAASRLAPVGDAVGDNAGVSSLDWPALRERVAACTACGLCESRKNTVFGVGDPNASWMFIGEGPGRQEDLQGDPFIGPAGKLLDNMLKAIGAGRSSNAYIANIVKCRPTAEGRDRAPSAEEAQACQPYLQRQVELVKPQVIVALGKTAAINLLGLPPDTPVSSLRGKVHRYLGRPLVVTYHPAYLLRQPADKAHAWRDLCLAMEQHGDAG